MVFEIGDNQVQSVKSLIFDRIEKRNQKNMEHTTPPNSPTWGTNTKLVVALTIIVVVGALLVNFQFIITPLMIALTLAYLFHPLADFFQRKFRFSWSASVAVIYFIIILLLIGLLTLGGVGLVQQIQSLVIVVQDALKNLPQLIENICMPDVLLLVLIQVSNKGGGIGSALVYAVIGNVLVIAAYL